MKSPLIIPTIFWLLGLIAGQYFSLPIIFLICLIIFLVTASVFLKRHRNLSIPILIFFLGIFHFTIIQYKPENHISNILDRFEKITQPITGRIVSKTTAKKGRYYFVLELSGIDDRKVSGKINFSSSEGDLHYGDHIRTIAEINSISRNSNPAAFNFQKYMATKGIYATGFSRAPVEVIKNDVSSLKNFILQIRESIKKKIVNRFGRNSEFVQAIILGDKSELTDFRDEMTRAGLSHLLAVSGLHVGILSLVLFTILKIFLRKRNLTRIVLILILFMYGAICNWTPSVSRAVLMISLYLISQIIQRKSDTNNILAVSCFVITFIDPRQLFLVGFQLSFTAVFVLLNIVPRFRLLKVQKQDLLAMSFGKKLLNSVLLLIFVSIILNLFLSPIIMYHFNQFNFNGIAGNILGIPLLSLILPLALLIIFLPDIPFILELYQNSFQIVMMIFKKWTLMSSNFPLFNNFSSLNFIQVTIWYLTLLSVYFFIRYFRKNRIFYLPLVFSSLLIISQIMSFGKDQNLKITFFDCGLGDLSMIETPDDKIMFIDCGPPAHTYLHFRNSALPYLQEKGISTIDWLLVTHAHNDHYGGLEFILEELKVKSLIVTDEFQNRKIWQNYEKLLNEEKCRIITISDTTHIGNSDLKLKIIHPDHYYYDENINNSSIVMRLDHRDFSALFMGDAEKEVEKYLLKNYSGFLDCDLLKIGHHGSKTSSSTAFIEAVSPRFAFIPTSRKNRFNFPHQKTLNTFSFLEENLFIAGWDGALQVISDGQEAHFQTCLSQKNFIVSDLTHLYH